MLRVLDAYLARVLYPIAERMEKRNISATWKSLQASMALSPEARQHQQRQQLITILQSAKAHVPYYRELFRKLGFYPERLKRDIDYLQKLPLLTKEVIREQGHRMCDERLDPAHLHLRKTGGSTGSSVSIYYSTQALDVTAAVNRFVLGWAGRTLEKREVHLASNFPEKFPWRDRVKEALKCAALNRKNIYTASFDDDALKNLWRQLQRLKPFLVQGHPSTLYALAHYTERKGIDATKVMAVFESTGEVLGPAQRELITISFDCRVINRYGNAEFGVVAYESPDSPSGRMKLLEPIVYPENRVEDQSAPEIILTGLTNSAMPLIRYRTGDLGKIEHDEYGQSWLQDVEGRIHDVITIGNRSYPTHYIQDLLDRIGGILEFQVETIPGQPVPVLRIVTEPNVDQEAIKHRLGEWWGKNIIVEFIAFEQIKRIGRRGKFRYLITPDIQ